MLDYQYFSNHYTVVACDLSKQSVLDSDPRAVQEIEFIYKLDNGTNSQILRILEKEKQTILEFSKDTVKVLEAIYKMVEYNKINAKLSNLQLNKLEPAVQNNEGQL